MYCKNCGSVINQGEIFCRKCGTKVENNMSQMENPVAQMFQNSQMQQPNNINNTQYQNQTQYMANNNYNQVPKKKKKIWIPIIIIIILLIIIVPLVVNYFATYANYETNGLRFYVNPDWECDDNVCINESETCAVTILSKKVNKSEYEQGKDELESIYSITYRERSVNSNMWDYASSTYEGSNLKSYLTYKNGSAYIILYIYDKTDEECTKYVERFENSLKFKE